MRALLGNFRLEHEFRGVCVESSLLLVGIQVSMRLWHESQCQRGNLMRASDTCQRSWWRAPERICVNMLLLFMKIGLWQLLGGLASDTHRHKLYYVADASIRLCKASV